MARADTVMKMTTAITPTNSGMLSTGIKAASQESISHFVVRIKRQFVIWAWSRKCHFCWGACEMNSPSVPHDVQNIVHLLYTKHSTKHSTKQLKGFCEFGSNFSDIFFIELSHKFGRFFDTHLSPIIYRLQRVTAMIMVVWYTCWCLITCYIIKSFLLWPFHYTFCHRLCRVYSGWGAPLSNTWQSWVCFCSLTNKQVPVEIYIFSPSGVHGLPTSPNFYKNALD